MIDKKLIYEKAINKNGSMLQKVVCTEELAELIKEIVKDLRGESTKTQILTEIADVSICLEQLQLMFNINDKELEEEINFKLVRLNNRINEELENAKN